MALQRVQHIHKQYIITNMYIPYSRKLSREKTFVTIKKYDFRRENFHGLLTFTMPIDFMFRNFAEKSFTNSHKSVKFAKVFSLECFPLYGSVSNYSTQKTLQQVL